MYIVVETGGVFGRVAVQCEMYLKSLGYKNIKMVIRNE